MRTLGVDDGYFPPTFKRRLGKTLLAVVACEGVRVTDIRVSAVTVDGLDATGATVGCLMPLGKEYLAVFLDGVTYAGFNVVDPEVVYRETGVPAITIFRHKLNLSEVKRALINNFGDWWDRYSIIEKVHSSAREVLTPRGRLLISCYGVGYREAYTLIAELQTVSYCPEPLRLAGLIASGLTRSGTLLKFINRESSKKPDQPVV